MLVMLVMLVSICEIAKFNSFGLPRPASVSPTSLGLRALSSRELVAARTGSRRAASWAECLQCLQCLQQQSQAASEQKSQGTCSLRCSAAPSGKGIGRGSALRCTFHGKSSEGRGLRLRVWQRTLRRLMQDVKPPPQISPSSEACVAKSPGGPARSFRRGGTPEHHLAAVKGSGSKTGR